jgi:hypothetical protein
MALTIRAGPLDPLEELVLAKGCVTVAGKPGMRAAMHKAAIAVEFALDSRPEESNDKVIARGGANVYVFHDNDLSICPASAGHFFVFQNFCYGRLSCRCRTWCRSSERGHRAASTASV